MAGRLRHVAGICRYSLLVLTTVVFAGRLLSTSAVVSPSTTLNSTTWTPLGPAPIVNGQRAGNGPVSGRISGIAAHPTDPNIIYIGAAGGGVWKTTDGGTTWNPLTDSKSTLSIGAIAIAPSNPQVLYAGTGEWNNSIDSNFGRGILLSSDAGATWTLLNNKGAFDLKRVSEIAIDPTNSNVAYAAVNGCDSTGCYSGIQKTTDGGSTWVNTTAAVTSIEPWSSIRIDPNNPSILYAAVGDIYGSLQNGVYKSTNGGVTWSALTAAPRGMAAGRIVVAVAKTNSQVIYVSTAGTGTSGSSTFGSLFKLMRSDNGGATFTDLTEATPNYLGVQGWYDTTLIVDPTNSAVVYAGGQGTVLRSTTSGTSWTDISSGPAGGPEANHHAAAFDASGRYLDGNDGGIYRLTDPATQTWAQLNGNLNTIQFQGIGLHPTDPSIALGGSQGNGVSRYSGTAGWSLVEPYGGSVKFSPTNSARVYHQAPVLTVGSADFFRRSDDGGVTWTSTVNGISDNTTSLQRFYAPFVVDRSNGDRVLYGARRLWESTNGGDSWTALGPAFSSNVAAIGLSPSDPETIYVSTEEGYTFFTNNRGATWTLRNLTPAPVQDIQVDPADPLKAYVAIRNFRTSVGNVLRTIDGGISWTDISGNLPDVPAWSLQIDPSAANTLYLGNDIGVYRTSDGGISWNRFGAGLPNAQVYQIELNTTLNILGAATHGRGLWEIQTPSLETFTLTNEAVVVAALTASPTSIAPGGILTATWSAIASPSSNDWIGLYQPGAANTAFIDFMYVSCSKTAGSPRASGSCPFVLPGNLAPGTYQLRLLPDNQFSVLATSNDFTVTGGGGAALTASPTSIAPGGILTATWSAIASPSSNDWIGLYQPGAANTAFIDFMYVSCSKTAGSPRAWGSCPFVLPGNLAPGTYQLRLLPDNQFSVLATSNDFTVTGGGAALTASPTSIAPGGILTATWSAIASPSSNDWIALYQPGAANTAYIDWMYVSCSKTAGSPRASGSCPFVLPGNLAPGTYQLRFLANDQFSVLATSNLDVAIGSTPSLPADITPPVVSLISVTNITTSGATVNWMTNEPADGQVEFISPCPASGCLTTLVSAPTTSHAINVSGLSANTLYSYRIRSKDPTGNLAITANQTFTTAVTANSCGAIVSGTVTLAASATDNVGVVGVQFKLDGANFGPEFTTAPYSIPWNTTTAPNGCHVLTAVARNAAGNQGTASMSVNVSNP